MSVALTWGCSVLATMGGEGSSVKRRGWVEGGRRPGEWEGSRERQGRDGIDSKEGGVDIRVSVGRRGREGREGRVGVLGRIDREEREGRVGVSGRIDREEKVGRVCVSGSIDREEREGGVGVPGSNCREESDERERVMGT